MGTSNYDILEVLLNWMEENHPEYRIWEYPQKIIMRRRGYVFDLRDHCEAMVLSLLSANRPWIQIENNLANLEIVFGNYEPDYLLNADPNLLMQKVTYYGCGNRRIAAQMSELNYNINTFKRIESVISLNEFDVSDSPIRVATALSSGHTKLKGVAITLAFEILKRVGVDCAKPDVHLHRLLERWDLPAYTEMSIQNSVKIMADLNNISCIQAAGAMWLLCATGYCEICTATPKCYCCPLKEHCPSSNVLFK